MLRLTILAFSGRRDGTEASVRLERRGRAAWIANSKRILLPSDPRWTGPGFEEVGEDSHRITERQEDMRPAAWTIPCGDGHFRPGYARLIQTFVERGSLTRRAEDLESVAQLSRASATDAQGNEKSGPASSEEE